MSKHIYVTYKFIHWRDKENAAQAGQDQPNLFFREARGKQAELWLHLVASNSFACVEKVSFPQEQPLALLFPSFLFSASSLNF